MDLNVGVCGRIKGTCGYKEGRVGTKTSPGVTAEHATCPEQLRNGEEAWETIKVTKVTNSRGRKGSKGLNRFEMVHAGGLQGRLRENLI